MGDVDIFADSILLSPDTNNIEAKKLSLYCNYLNVANVNNFNGIWTTEGVHVNTSAGGTADFSGVTQQYAIYSEYGLANEIYSDYIIEPAGGLAYIFHPTPLVYQSNTSIKRAFIGSVDEVNFAGTTDTLFLTLQNQSMLSQVLDYKISSKQGWVQMDSNSTSQIQPFEFYYLDLLYTIPYGTQDNARDTVEMIVSIGDDFSDTSICYIECKDSLITLIPEFRHMNSSVLFQNYPNPFNLSTTIGFTLEEEGMTSLELYDQTGKLSQLLFQCFKSKGHHEYTLEKADYDNGLYFYILKQNGKTIGSKSFIVY
jgi:hypothetical protein